MNPARGQLPPSLVAQYRPWVSVMNPRPVRNSLFGRHHKQVFGFSACSSARRRAFPFHFFTCLVSSRSRQPTPPRPRFHHPRLGGDRPEITDSRLTFAGRNLCVSSWAGFLRASAVSATPPIRLLTPSTGHAPLLSLPRLSLKEECVPPALIPCSEATRASPPGCRGAGFASPARRGLSPEPMTASSKCTV